MSEAVLHLPSHATCIHCPVCICELNQTMLSRWLKCEGCQWRRCWVFEAVSPLYCDKAHRSIQGVLHLAACISPACDAHSAVVILAGAAWNLVHHSTLHSTCTAHALAAHNCAEVTKAADCMLPFIVQTFSNALSSGWCRVQERGDRSCIRNIHVTLRGSRSCGETTGRLWDQHSQPWCIIAASPPLFHHATQQRHDLDHEVLKLH